MDLGAIPGILFFYFRNIEHIDIGDINFSVHWIVGTGEQTYGCRRYYFSADILPTCNFKNTILCWIQTTNSVK